MEGLVAHHRRALDEFDARVRAIRDDQWHDPTPCSEWDVRDLVNHLVYEQLWVPPLLDGATIEDVGARFEGDQLGDDPVGTWARSSVAAHDAVAVPGALERTVHLSFGDTAASDYVLQLVSDLVVHAWDLARAVGADEALDPELVGLVHDVTVPQLGAMQSSGLFDPPVAVADDAGAQAKLLGLFGRRA